MRKKLFGMGLVLLVMLTTLAPSLSAAMADTDNPESNIEEPEGEWRIIIVEIPYFDPVSGLLIMIHVPVPVWVEP